LLLGPLSLMEVLMLLLSLIYHKPLSFFMCMCVFWCRYIVAGKLFDDMLMRHGNVHPYGSMVTSARWALFLHMFAAGSDCPQFYPLAKFGYLWF
jgi:hypothetical protein